MLVPTYRTTKYHNPESHSLTETDPYSCLNMIHFTCVWKCVRILRLASNTAFCFPVTKNVRDKSFDDDISICAPVSLMICKQVRTDSPSPNLSLWSNLRSSKGTLKTCNTRVQFQICWSLMQWCRYEGESNENLKSAIKIRNTARLSCKLTTMILMVWRVATGDSTMQEGNMTVQ